MVLNWVELSDVDMKQPSDVLCLHAGLHGAHVARDVDESPRDKHHPLRRRRGVLSMFQVPGLQIFDIEISGLGPINEVLAPA